MTRLLSLPPVDTRGRYLSWDEARRRRPPDGLTAEEWWAGMRMSRRAASIALPLFDKSGSPFAVCEPEPVRRLLHWLDLRAGGSIGAPSLVTTEETRKRYLISSLIEEAFSSSVLEGAATTRRAAKEMIREGRKPRSRDEIMVLNNYHAMEFVRGLRDDPLSVPAILRLHEIVTRDTLDDPAKAGRLRHDDDDVKIVDDRDGTVLHVPPASEELEERLDALCIFANAEADSAPFIHPIVRAILIHFMIGYDHPFVDGNGRMARALFYWSMARSGYWLAEYLSISRVIKKHPARYGTAYLNTETDGGDTTYFVINQLDVVAEALSGLYAYLEEKSRESQDIEALLQRSEYRDSFNHRQARLLHFGVTHPGAQVTIKEHAAYHGVSYLTARSDLDALAAAGLLEKRRLGRTNIFRAPTDLADRIVAGRRL
ncbi:MAG: Fic family protein [Azospirillaceae bacterium]